MCRAAGSGADPVEGANQKMKELSASLDRLADTHLPPKEKKNPMDDRYIHQFHCEDCETSQEVYVKDPDVSEVFGTEAFTCECPICGGHMIMDEVYGPKVK